MHHDVRSSISDLTNMSIFIDNNITISEGNLQFFSTFVLMIIHMYKPTFAETLFVLLTIKTPTLLDVVTLFTTYKHTAYKLLASMNFNYLSRNSLFIHITDVSGLSTFLC